MMVFVNRMHLLQITANLTFYRNLPRTFRGKCNTRIQAKSICLLHKFYKDKRGVQKHRKLEGLRGSTGYIYGSVSYISETSSK